jgi:hypothetical protein
MGLFIRVYLKFEAFAVVMIQNRLNPHIQIISNQISFSNAYRMAVTAVTVISFSNAYRMAVTGPSAVSCVHTPVLASSPLSLIVSSGLGKPICVPLSSVGEASGYLHP